MADAVPFPNAGPPPKRARKRRRSKGPAPRKVSRAAVLLAGLPLCVRAGRWLLSGVGAAYLLRLI